MADPKINPVSGVIQANKPGSEFPQQDARPARGGVLFQSGEPAAKTSVPPVATITAKWKEDHVAEQRTIHSSPGATSKPEGQPPRKATNVQIRSAINDLQSRNVDARRVAQSKKLLLDNAQALPGLSEKLTKGETTVSQKDLEGWARHVEQEIFRENRDKATLMAEEASDSPPTFDTQPYDPSVRLVDERPVSPKELVKINTASAQPPRTETVISAPLATYSEPPMSYVVTEQSPDPSSTTFSPMDTWQASQMIGDFGSGSPGGISSRVFSITNRFGLTNVPGISALGGGGGAASASVAAGGAGTAAATGAGASAASGGALAFLANPWVLGTVIVVGVLLLLLLTTSSQTNQVAMERFTPLGVGGAGGQGVGTFGPTCNFDDVCWPISEEDGDYDVRVSETPDGHHARGGVSDGGSAIDIGTGGREGLDVISPVSGTVVFAGLDPNTATDPDTGYGNYVQIKITVGDELQCQDSGSQAGVPSNDMYLIFAHLSSIAVSEGGAVGANETKIGDSGNTGNSTGPHLHYEAIGVSIKSLMPRPDIQADGQIAIRCE